MPKSVVKKIREAQRSRRRVRVVRRRGVPSLEVHLRTLRQEARESEQLTEEDFLVRANTRG